jgi:hypothetical protein
VSFHATTQFENRNTVFPEKNPVIFARVFFFVRPAEARSTWRGGAASARVRALMEMMGWPRPPDFKNGREFAAFLGLVPRQNSTGGKTKLFEISKRGERLTPYLCVHPNKFPKSLFPLTTGRGHICYHIAGAGKSPVGQGIFP